MIALRRLYSQRIVRAFAISPPGLIAERPNRWGYFTLMISRIEVEQHACIGCGTCWVACPEAFKEHDLGDDLKALPTGGLGNQQTMRTAAEGCPTLAILLIDAEGGLIFPSEEARTALRGAAERW